MNDNLLSLLCFMVAFAIMMALITEKVDKPYTPILIVALAITMWTGMGFVF